MRAESRASGRTRECLNEPIYYEPEEELKAAKKVMKVKIKGLEN